MTRNQIALLWSLGALWPIVVIVRHALNLQGGYDFDILYAAGQHAGVRAYDLFPPAAGFRYPPLSFFLFQPIAALPRPLADMLWAAISIGAFTFAAAPYLRRARLPILLSVLTPAALICLSFGQTSLLMGALFLLAFRGHWWAVPLAAIKPTTGFTSILALRNRAMLGKALLLGALLLVASILAFGTDSWLRFISLAVTEPKSAKTNPIWVYVAVAPYIAYGLAGWLTFGAAAVLMLSRRVSPFTIAAATPLIAPYAMHYDLTVACLGYAIALSLHWKTMPWHYRLALFAGWMAPTIVNLGMWFVPPVLLWALWAMVNLPADEPQQVTGMES